jgi:hypothetical protein
MSGLLELLLQVMKGRMRTLSLYRLKIYKMFSKTDIFIRKLPITLPSNFSPYYMGIKAGNEVSWSGFLWTHQMKKDSVAISLQANYTDWGAVTDGETSAAFLRADCVAWSAQRIPTTVNIGFLGRSCCCFSKKFLSYSLEAEWTPFQKHYFTEYLVEPGIEH